MTTKTLKKGLGLTIRHLKEATKSRKPMAPNSPNYFDLQSGIMTTQYPKEVIPVPHNGRYKLHNEIEDCIVCDKCAKICPVDCIDIEPIRAVEEFGKTSDGTSKRIYAAKFDIDMAKCCFCGLCTTVCPTECLTMTDEYDFSAYDFEEHNFAFAEMTPLEILEKKKELEEFTAKKEAAKQQVASLGGVKPKIPIKPKVGGGVAKPVMRPKVGGVKPAAKPVIKPKMTSTEGEAKVQKPRPKIPIKPKTQGSEKKDNKDKETSGEKKKPQVARPKIPMKPKIPKRGENNDSSEQ